MLSLGRVAVPGLIAVSFLAGGVLGFFIPSGGDSTEDDSTVAVAADSREGAPVTQADAADAGTPAPAPTRAAPRRTPPAPTRAAPRRTPPASSPTGAPSRPGPPGEYAYIVNGNDKLPKLKRLYGEDTVLTLVARQPGTGVEVLRIADVYHTHTDLNQELAPGSYEVLFYDASGKLLSPSADVGEVVVIKP